MKTKTQEQLEKEILFRQKFKPVLTPKQFKELLRLCDFSFNFAKKNFEKLIDDRIQIQEKFLKEQPENKKSIQWRIIGLKEIKEALKNL